MKRDFDGILVVMSALCMICGSSWAGDALYKETQIENRSHSTAASSDAGKTNTTFIENLKGISSSQGKQASAPAKNIKVDPSKGIDYPASAGVHQNYGVFKYAAGSGSQSAAPVTVTVSAGSNQTAQAATANTSGQKFVMPNSGQNILVTNAAGQTSVMNFSNSTAFHFWQAGQQLVKETIQALGTWIHS